MIPEIVKRWELNKHKLAEHFATLEDRGITYEGIFRKLFELVINKDDDYEMDFDLSQVTVIDHGSYQGTQLFIIPRKRYQPTASDYIGCDNSYGSCSGCDTLEGIWDYGSYEDGEKISKQTVDELMTLSLHLVQRMRWLFPESI